MPQRWAVFCSYPQNSPALCRPACALQQPVREGGMLNAPPASRGIARHGEDPDATCRRATEAGVRVEARKIRASGALAGREARGSGRGVRPVDARERAPRPGHGASACLIGKGAQTGCHSGGRADSLGTTNVQGTVEAMDACLSLETNRRRASLSRCRTGFDLSLGAPAADLLTLL